MKAFSLLVPLVAAAYVSAHGILTHFAVNGQDQGRDVIRQVSSQDPNHGADNPALTCGPNAKAASNNARVMPGDTLAFDWRTASGTPWPHNTGPMMTYLASCGDVTCDKFDASNAQWFKIDQVGRKDNSGNWFQGDLMSGAPASVKLPSTLAPGNYLVRHEVLALHLAQTVRMAEFYPGCAQLIVGGSGTGRPAAKDLVRLPGAYSDEDPGIHVDVFSTNSYTFPGPAVSQLGGTGSAPAPAGGNNGSNNNNGGTPKPSATPTPAAPAKTGKSGSCHLKKNKRYAVDAETLEDDSVHYVPRHLSRVMRRLAFEQTH